MAVPGKVVEITDVQRRLARVEVAGVDRRVNLSLLDEAEQPEPGEWVLVHVGLALSRISEAEAIDQLRLLDEISGAYADAVRMEPTSHSLNLEATT